MGRDSGRNDLGLIALVVGLYLGALIVALAFNLDVLAVVGGVFLLSTVGYALASGFLSRVWSQMSYADRTRAEDEWRGLGSLIGCGFLLTMLLFLLYLYGFVALSEAWRTWGPR